MTLKGVVAGILHYFSEISRIRAHCIKVVEGIPKLSATEMQSKASSF